MLVLRLDSLYGRLYGRCKAKFQPTELQTWGWLTGKRYVQVLALGGRTCLPDAFSASLTSTTL